VESRPKWMLNEFIINNLNSGCQWYKVRENKKSHRGTLTLLFDSSRPSLMQTLTVFVWWWLTAQTARVEASTHHTTLDATIQIRVRPWNRMPIFYCVHRIANSLLLDVYTIQQTSRKIPANVFKYTWIAGRLLDRVNTPGPLGFDIVLSPYCFHS